MSYYENHQHPADPADHPDDNLSRAVWWVVIADGMGVVIAMKAPVTFIF